MSEKAPSIIKKKHATHDINSNSVLEVNNMMDSDGKVEDDEPKSIYKKDGKNSNSNSTAKNTNSKSNANKGVMLIKEEVAKTNASTQYTPRQEQKKQGKRDIGVSVATKSEIQQKKIPTKSVGIVTELTMSNNNISTNAVPLNTSDSKRKKSSKQTNKIQKSNYDDFQDVELINHKYDLKAFHKNKIKRQKSNEKKKARTKGSSHDSLKTNSKVGYSTPE